MTQICDNFAVLQDILKGVCCKIEIDPEKHLFM